MPKDIHAKPFDEGTMVKLELFKLYFREWLPVFTKNKSERIEIYDFFAGEGTDSEGSYGSPLIILDELKAYCDDFKYNPTKVVVNFNDYSTLKASVLDINVNLKLHDYSDKCNFGFSKTSESKLNCPFEINNYNRDFQDFFATEYERFYKTTQTPRFILIDQYGIKHVTTEVFNQLTNLQKTDFLFFISSNHIRRFKEHPGFKAY